MPAPAKKAAAVKRPAGWPDKLPSGAPFPVAMGEVADRLYRQRAERLALQRKQEEELAKVKKDEDYLREFIINELPKSKAGGIVGESAKAEIVTKEVPRVSEGGWPKVYAKIVDLYLTHKKKKDGQEDGAFALLQRRLGDAAVKEMWEAGVAVPGVEKFTAVDVSITKR